MDPTAAHTDRERVARAPALPDDAVRHLPPTSTLTRGFARIDHHRDWRQGMPEAVFGPGKTPEQCAAIVAGAARCVGAAALVLLARALGLSRSWRGRRASPEPLGYGSGEVSGTGAAHTVVFRAAPARAGTVVVVTAGTSDLPVATECTSVLGALGFSPTLLVDCGVSGLHRLLAEVDTLAMADAVVVIAGMEGALASVVGGLTPAPVIAVPTSTGYGAALEGVTALLSMLASCSSGVAVVGIDNGFGAACAVARLLP